jgi:hypothetical protein
MVPGDEARNEKEILARHMKQRELRAQLRREQEAMMAFSREDRQAVM